MLVHLIISTLFNQRIADILQLNSHIFASLTATVTSAIFCILLLSHFFDHFIFVVLIFLHFLLWFSFLYEFVVKIGNQLSSLHTSCICFTIQHCSLLSYQFAGNISLYFEVFNLSSYFVVNALIFFSTLNLEILKTLSFNDETAPI